MKTGLTAGCCLFLCLSAQGADLSKDRKEEIVKRILQNLHERVKTLEDKVQPKEKKPLMSVGWKDRLIFSTSEGNFQLSLGGLVQNDWAFMVQTNKMRRRIGPFEDGTEFPRARICAEGLLWKRFVFKAQYDFAEGITSFRDVYLGLEKPPFFDRLLVGQFKEPFSYGILTDTRDVPFLERSTPATTFAPNRNTGLLVERSFFEERTGIAIGGFHDTNAFGSGVNDNEAEYSVSTRLWIHALQNKEGDLLSLSVAYRYAQPPSDQVRFQSRPELHLAPVVVDTGPISARHLHQVDLAGIAVWQRFWAQSEYIYTFVDRPYGSDPQFSGVSASCGFFLTGERKPIRRGLSSRIRPKKRILRDGGSGAWELAARYSFVGLNDENVSGGRLHTATFGVNWYLTSFLRVTLNYIYVRRICHGEAHIVAWRFQLAF